MCIRDRSEQSQPNAYQQAYYGQTQAKGTGTGFGIASLVLGILSVFTFACCINYILAVLAIIFGIVQLSLIHIYNRQLLFCSYFPRHSLLYEYPFHQLSYQVSNNWEKGNHRDIVR